VRRNVVLYVVIGVALAKIKVQLPGAKVRNYFHSPFKGRQGAVGLGSNRCNPCRFSEAADPWESTQRELPLDVRQKAELDIHIPRITCEGLYDKITELFFWSN